MIPSAADLLLGIGLPAVVAGLLLLLLRRAFAGSAAGGSATGGVAGAALAGALAVGLGYVAGHIGVRGWRGWEPREAVDRIPIVVLAGLVVGAAGLLRRGPPRLRSAVRVLLAAGATWIVVGKPLARELGNAGMLRELLLLGAGIALAWSAVESLATPAVRGGPFALLLLLATGCALVLGISGSAVLARLAGAMAAALGAVLVLGSRRPGGALLLGVTPPAVLGLGALLVAGLRLAAVPSSSALLLVAAPVAAFAVRLLAGARARRVAGSAGGAAGGLSAGSAGASGAGSVGGSGGDGAGTLLVQLLVAGALVGAAFALALQASPPLDETGY